MPRDDIRIFSVVRARNKRGDSARALQNAESLAATEMAQENEMMEDIADELAAEMQLEKQT
mgnify:CR=1 FL=1